MCGTAFEDLGRATRGVTCNRSHSAAESTDYEQTNEQSQPRCGLRNGRGVEAVVGVSPNYEVEPVDVAIVVKISIAESRVAAKLLVASSPRQVVEPVDQAVAIRVARIG
jgi:hypothetical protein